MDIHGTGQCRGIVATLKSFLRRFPISAFILIAYAVTASSASAAISYVQSRSKIPTGSGSTVSLAYSSAQIAGDFNVVMIGWGATSVTVQSITDTKGNVYSRVAGPTTVSGIGTQSIYYAKNVVAATAGSNTVTVTFSASTASRDLRIASYRGVDTTNPVDVFVSNTGTSTTSSSGAMTTTNANDLIVAGNYTESTTTAAGSGYTSRMITGFGSILEDKILTSAGSNTATASLNVTGRWIMQAAAFKAAGSGGADTTPPTQPTGATATATSSTQINLSWSPSTDTGSGMAGYRVERCIGAACSTFAQIATPTTTSYSDTGLTASTTYRYQVRAVDVAGNVSSASTIASATTQAAPDTTPPDVGPTNLTVAVVSTNQLKLSWTAAHDNVGITGYRIERCTGSACSSFVQIGTSATTTFNNTGLTTNTTYRYRVRANDAAGNLSAYSSIANGTTQGGDTTPPTQPSGLTVTAISDTQCNLSWSASTDTQSGMAGYRVERCTGTSCSTFAQISAPTATSYSDTGLAASTTYRYQVRAVDVAGNASSPSTVVSATTQAPPDATPPDVGPTNLTVTVASTTQLNLSWTAAHDNIAITGYRIEGCTGSLCNFIQIATSTTTTYSNTGLTPGTTYSYRVIANDAAGNLSSYSNVASGSTQQYLGRITYTYSYDSIGRVTQMVSSIGQTINYQYDSNGNLTVVEAH